MRTDALFLDIKKHSNVRLLENIDSNTKINFQNQYSHLQDKLFFEVIENCGGIVFDNWVRLYGCGELNVVAKNDAFLKNSTLDILIGEDVLGGLFGLKDNVVYYFAPDLLQWECLQVYYANFINWLINEPQNVELFYRIFKWNTWKEDSSKLALNEGFAFHPFLFQHATKADRSRAVISIDEVISIHFDIMQQLGKECD